MTAHDRRFDHRASLAIGCRTAVRAGQLVPVDQSGDDSSYHGRHSPRCARFNMLIAGDTPPNSTVMAIYHHPRQRRRRRLRRNPPDIIPIAHARQARFRSIRLPIGPALHCSDVRDRGTDLNPHAFRRCRSVIPRSCRSLFRHDVARLSGVLLAVVFWLLACWWSILCSCSRSGPAQAVAGEIEAMGVVDEAVEDGVGIGRVADDPMPFVDRDLAGQDG